MTEKPIKKEIFIKRTYENLPTTMVNIQELPKDEYEHFLEEMHRTRLAYLAIIQSNQDQEDK